MPCTYRLVGLKVKASVSRAVDSGFDRCLRRGDFSGSSQIRDRKLPSSHPGEQGNPGSMD